MSVLINANLPAVFPSWNSQICSSCHARKPTEVVAQHPESDRDYLSSENYFMCRGREGDFIAVLFSTSLQTLWANDGAAGSTVVHSEHSRIASLGNSEPNHVCGHHRPPDDNCNGLQSAGHVLLRGRGNQKTSGRHVSIFVGSYWSK